MNSWQIIKASLTKSKRPGSSGYFASVYIAAQLFMEIKGNLKDESAASATFDTDLEVTEAAFVAPKLKSIGVLR